jgi:phage protein D
MSVDGNSVTVWPSVRIGAGGGTALTGDAADGLVRTVVDTHLLLPGMFVLAFSDMTGASLTDAGISIGTTVQVWVEADGDDQACQLISGEVTAIEGRYEYLTGVTVVRGYDLGHRLQRVRRTRTFVNMTDSDIATQIAREGGLTLGGITATSVVHDHLGQCDETDWDFLKQRAREIGYEFGMVDGKFQFRKASSVSGAEGEPLTLTLGQNLRLFMPRVTAGNLTPNVEVRVWDPLQAHVTAETASTSASTANITGQAAAALGRKFGLAPEGSGAAAKEDAGESAGPPPSPTAHVISDRPVGSGASASSAATLVASGLAEHLGTTFAEAEGDATGSPKIQAGAVVKTEGVPSQFTGSWVVTNARHVFDLAEGGYRTGFVVSGRHERSLLGLASAGATQSPLPRMPGVVCGIVTNVNDTKGRAKVTLPWLSPQYESDWAPVVQFGAGKRSGAMFLPEVGDEVLVGFEFGDARRPYVLGGLVNNNSAYSLGGSAVQPKGETAAVVRRGFVSAAGNRLVFHDELPPGDGGGPPAASEITLGTGDSKFRLAIDAVAGTLIVACTPDDPPGHLTIQCGNAGTVDIKTGDGGTVNIDGGTALSLKARESVTIQSDGEVSIKGAQIKLN